ncbi:MFS transporter [Aeromicrobium sp. CF4.19]|uniref:MFS transporter n=1 Tax=Aeromicrobium sp. CF4.19 TaxID=3373082 RepID=UPI003EE4A7AC
MFLAGFMIAPTLISAMSIIEMYVHPARLTEGMAWTITALSAGVALGAALVGWVVDHAGARAWFSVPLVAAATAAVVAWCFKPGPPADRGLVPDPITH